MDAPFIQRYLARRRTWEVLLVVGIVVVNWAANSIVVVLDFERSQLPFERWEAVVWEGTSSLMIALLVPVMLAFDRAFPLRIRDLQKGLLAHVLFTVPWSLLHVGGMVGLRKLIYQAVGGAYEFGSLGVELFYEYLKDFRSYFGLIALIYLYRFVLLRLQGEARFLAEEHEEQETGAVVDRFLVKKLGREFLVRVDDIDWIESSGNYINLHVGGRLYPLRETMTNIERRLKDAGFTRVHRTAIVNMDRVAEIEPFDTGDARARLESGQVVPISRRYRSALKAELS